VSGWGGGAWRSTTRCTTRRFPFSSYMFSLVLAKPDRSRPALDRRAGGMLVCCTFPGASVFARLTLAGIGTIEEAKALERAERGWCGRWWYDTFSLAKAPREGEGTGRSRWVRLGLLIPFHILLIFGTGTYQVQEFLVRLIHAAHVLVSLWERCFGRRSFAHSLITGRSCDRRIIFHGLYQTFLRLPLRLSIGRLLVQRRGVTQATRSFPKLIAGLVESDPAREHWR
jgi:hypothetical protein